MTLHAARENQQLKQTHQNDMKLLGKTPKEPGMMGAQNDGSQEWWEPGMMGAQNDAVPALAANDYHLRQLHPEKLSLKLMKKYIWQTQVIYDY